MNPMCYYRSIDSSYWLRIRPELHLCRPFSMGGGISTILGRSYQHSCAAVVETLVKHRSRIIARAEEVHGRPWRYPSAKSTFFLYLKAIAQPEGLVQVQAAADCIVTMRWWWRETYDFYSWQMWILFGCPQQPGWKPTTPTPLHRRRPPTVWWLSEILE